MKNPTISIIVPVYNVKPYLKKCIKSILNQTFKDFELLLIDDGSTDGSGKICDELALQDERIKVFHQSNKGVSSARNAGLERAYGEWIGFVDSDDFCEKKMFQVLLENATIHEVDFSVCGSVDIKNNDKSSFYDNFKNQIMSAYTARKTLIGKYHFIYCRNCIIKSDVIKRNNIIFNENFLRGEDTIFIYETLLKTDKIYLTTELLYNRIVREDSLHHSKTMDDKIKIFDIYDIFLSSEKDEDIIKSLKQYKIEYAILYLIYSVTNNDIKYINKILKVVRENYIFMLKNKTNRAKRKIILLLAFFPKIVFMLMRIKKYIKEFKK